MQKVTLIVSKIAIAAGVVAGLMSVSAVVSADEVAEPGLTHECCNSPRGTVLPVVLKAIGEVSGPHSMILVAAYEFTSQPIARALIEAKRRGATVAVVADATENVTGKHAAYSKIHELIVAGIPVRVDNRLEMLHDKFMVLNGVAVEMGSFNYTAAAASIRHAENACVFRHAPEMAAEYTEHWKDIWNESDRVD